MTSASSLRMFDLVTLRLLVAAIEEGNLARVAARENISLSAVSRRLSDLEARLGVLLLRRHDRGVAPTDAALMTLDRIRSMLRLLDQIVIDLAEVREGNRGLVRLRAHLTAVVGELPDLLAGFHAGQPGIEVLLEEATSTEIVHAVRVGDCDIGLISGTVDDDGVTLLPWRRDRLVVVMPREHVLAERSALRFADLLDYPFIGMSRPSALQTLYEGQAAVLGRRLNTRANVSTFEGVRALVAASLGIGILPEWVAERGLDPQRLTVRNLAEDWSRRPLMIAVRDPAQLSKATRNLIDHLRRAEGVA